MFVFFVDDAGDDGALNIGRSCRKGKADCGYPPRFVWPTPSGDRDWRVRAVPRGHYSMSAEVRVGDDDHQSHALIHFGHGGWRVEALPTAGRVTEMQPDGASGLWLLIQADDEKTGRVLWHRSPQGTWTRRALPPKSGRAASIEISTAGAGRLWVVAAKKKAATLYALVPGEAPR